MCEPNFYISERCYRDAVRAGNWDINDLPNEVATAIRPFLGAGDSLGLFASGTLPPQPDQQGRVAGMDWVRHEPPERRRSDEGPLNFYHFVVKNRTDRGYPVFGPFPNNCIAPHHMAIFPISTGTSGGSLLREVQRSEKLLSFFARDQHDY